MSWGTLLRHCRGRGRAKGVRWKRERGDRGRNREKEVRRKGEEREGAEGWMRDGKMQE